MYPRFRDRLEKLPIERQEAIQARASAIRNEVASLRELRREQEKSQVDVAAALGVNQSAISKIERRSNLTLSALRAYLHAIGAELEITARFPGKDPVRINVDIVDSDDT